jgi:hypothetical protein
VEGGEERKERVLDDWGEWVIWNGIAGVWVITYVGNMLV